MVFLSPPAVAAQPPVTQEADTATRQEEVDAGAPAPQAPAAAQDSPGQATDTALPQPIREGELLSRAELVRSDLRRIEELLRPNAEVARIQSALLELEAEIVTLRATLDTVDPNRVSARQLADLRLFWLELEGELAAWATLLDARFDVLQVERERLREMQAQWERTAQQADIMDLSPEMLAQVADVLTGVRDAQDRVRERRNTVGALSGRIASRHELVLSSLRSIDAFAVAMRGRLFNREAAPLWRSLRAGSLQSFTGDVLGAGRDWAESLLTYVWLRLARIVFLALCSLALSHLFPLVFRIKGCPVGL